MLFVGRQKIKNQYMARPHFFILILCFVSCTIYGQQQAITDNLLLQQIYETGILHSPLPLDVSRSLEAVELKKDVLDTYPLSTETFKLTYRTFTGKRATGSPDDPDYATYGNQSINIPVGFTNWTSYNRLAFEVFPECPGARVVNINISSPAGSHLINLTNNTWNQCTLNLDGYSRDDVKNIRFTDALNGIDRTTGDSMTYYIRNIRLERVAHPMKTMGWLPDNDAIIYSTTGYSPDGQKQAIVSGKRKEHTFQLIDAISGMTMFEGNIAYLSTTIGQYGILDFTSFRGKGSFRLTVGETTSEPFTIAMNLWDNSMWRVLNFIFCQRCGYPVPNIHGSCHLDLFAEHNDKRISYAGGWHDAGDLSQQTLQTGDVTYALLEAYNALRAKEENTLLAARLLEEAEWGIDFILRTRYGDGYRASSMGLLIWQDGIIGTLDDIHTVRVQNVAFDNFLYAGYEAYAALSIDRDPSLQKHLTKIAQEDFAFAIEKYMREGLDKFPFMYEHTYNTSESQYMATVSWAATQLYKLTKQPYYAEQAAKFGQQLLTFQATDKTDRFNEATSSGDPTFNGALLRGFFYRDSSRRSIVHFNHQSREAIFMQALTELCNTQPQHPDYRAWADAIRLYGEHLKALMQYTEPYGMLPSGVYHTEEYTDSVGFYALNIFSPDDAVQQYVTQVKNGVQLGTSDYYVRRFPPWVTIYNGNTTTMLAAGKAAALCGRFLKDEILLDIAREQLYWTVGKNPFGQSLIYGEGYRYPQMDSFSSGEITGEIPVGIRTWGNEDVPYWPQTNNACYKEVWTTSAGKWLSLIAELENE
ncbi:MAG: glycoside hydrolase family 9 protein [Prevotellaceae bacterium]|jgi:hypothetical protein|nr:glycoside hydrolase family 9 protein [Prevotellaceae bacterium]